MENTNPVKTIFGFASVRDEKGEEMHKSKGNAIWFDDAVEKIGADPMRWMYAKQNPADNLKFGYNAADETKKKLLNLYNSITFFLTYVKSEELPDIKLDFEPVNVLDKWIVSRLNNLILGATKDFDQYDSGRAVSAIEKFFTEDLSLWYIRRSRKRFHQGNKERDDAVKTLYYVLLNLLKLIAPVMPFFAEEMYQVLRKNDMAESIHLWDWPRAAENKINKELEEKMAIVLEVVSNSMAIRAEAGIKVRQPLSTLKIKNESLKEEKELLELIKEEVNVKKIVFDKKLEKELELDTKITPELRDEGVLRDIIRYIQEMRKKAGLKPEDKISILAFGSKDLNELLKKKKDSVLKETLAENLKIENAIEDVIAIKEVNVSGGVLKIGIKK